MYQMEKLATITMFVKVESAFRKPVESTTVFQMMNATWVQTFQCSVDHPVDLNAKIANALINFPMVHSAMITYSARLAIAKTPSALTFKAK